jgi:hypothetical protein
MPDSSISGRNGIHDEVSKSWLPVRAQEEQSHFS